jgi:hypothetical protein
VTVYLDRLGDCGVGCAGSRRGGWPGPGARSAGGAIWRCGSTWCSSCTRRTGSGVRCVGCEWSGCPAADGWQRVTHALARAVAALARELDWTGVAAYFRLNWKTVAAAVEGAVLWGLAHRRWEPVHVLGLDEVSRRKGQQYLTVGYDLARGRVIWVGRDRGAIS